MSTTMQAASAMTEAFKAAQARRDGATGGNGATPTPNKKPAAAVKPLEVDFGGGFDPDAFAASLAEAQEAQAAKMPDVENIRARAAALDQVLVAIPLALWVFCMKQEPERKHFRAALAEADTPAVREHLQQQLKVLDDKMDPFFRGDVGGLFKKLSPLQPAEKDQAGAVCRTTWAIYQLAHTPTPSKYHVEWLLRRAEAIGLLTKLADGADLPRGAVMVYYNRDRYAFSAHAAEGIAIGALKEYGLRNAEAANKLGIPAEPSRIVKGLIELINTMQSARRAHIEGQLAELEAGVDGKTVADLRARKPGAYVLDCPEEVTPTRTYYQVKVRIVVNDKGYATVEGGFGPGARNAAKWAQESVEFAVDCLFADKAPQGAEKGSAYGAWATLHRGVVNELAKAAKREESAERTSSELAMCEAAAKAFGVKLGDAAEWHKGAQGFAVLTYYGRFGYWLKVPATDPRAKPTYEKHGVSAPSLVVERKAGADGKSRVVAHFTPERTEHVFADALGVEYFEADPARGDEPYGGVGNSVFRNFLKATMGRREEAKNDAPAETETAEAEATA